MISQIYLFVITILDKKKNLSFSRSNATLREEIESLKDCNRAKSELEDRIRKLERKLNVVQKDRDHYRTINEMFEREMTHVGGNNLCNL